jgi:hypothetical protein
MKNFNTKLMKTQKEIEQLAKEYSDIGKEAGLTYKEYTLENIAYIKGYTQCQQDMADKKYTEQDLRKAIELARETESVRRGALSEDWDDIEKYDEMDIIYLLNKQD